MPEAIDPELMRSRLLTIDAAKEVLAPTEGLQQYEFETDGRHRVHFEFPDGWNSDLDSKDDFAPTNATVRVHDTEIPLTKHGALDAASTVGISKSYAADTPGSLVTPHLNFHYNNGARGQKSLKLLAGNNGGLAFTRGTIQPFSNSALLDAVSEGIVEKYGDQELMVDYKLNNTLDRSNLRVIVPQHTRNIGSARAAHAGNDPWSVGIEITNSLTGAGSLELLGNLFAWWCTNGCTMEHSSSGRYRRSVTRSPEDAYDWARHAVDDVFNDLEHEFDTIEALTQIPLEGELNETVTQVFDKFKVPEDARDTIMTNLVESDDLSAYGLLNAITASANNPALSGTNVTSILRAGGAFARVIHLERCESCHRF
jgi:hypothetical protein